MYQIKPTTETITEHTPRNTKKLIFVLVFVFLGLCFIVAGAYSYLSNRNDGANQIENWKTYENKKYGFEIEYPDSWTYSGDNNQILLFRKDYSEVSSSAITISKDSVESVQKTVKDGVDDFLKNSISEKVIYFAGIKASYIGYGTAIGGSSGNIIFEKGGNTFWIEYNDYIAEDQKVISTFKFTN